jgi:iron(III) transport system substrate-binding protein
MFELRAGRRWAMAVWTSLALASLSLIGCAKSSTNDLVVYSARVEDLIKPLFDRYSGETGVAVRYVTDDAAPLIERLAAEGPNSPADILLTVDAGELWNAAERGLLQPVASKTLATSIPESLRDPEDRWVGLSVRARTIVYSTERVKPEQLSTYEALAEPQWRGKLCLRTSKKVYNQSLIAMLIAEHGAAKTEAVVRGWVANLATGVFSSDTLLMKAIIAGQCDVGIVNTYYFGRLEREQPGLPLKLFWADQAGAGVHVNVSGAGITSHAPHRAAAQKFLEWLATAEAQSLLASLNLEYPANGSVRADPSVLAWGEFKQSPMNVAQAGALQAEAVKLMDRAGYR